MRKFNPTAANIQAEHIRGLPVWVRAPKIGTEHYTGVSRPKLYELAARGLIRTCCIREPGKLKGARFFHLQSILDFLERTEKQEVVSTEVSEIPAPAIPQIKGQTVFAANARTGGGNEYLIGVFAAETDAWLASQRELDQGRKVWIDPLTIG